MAKRIFLLSGLAMLGVIMAHAAAWPRFVLTHDLWADPNGPIVVADLDRIGALTYYVLYGIQQLMVWSVPAFLFVSGFFVAYAGRGTQSSLSWKAVRTRVINLLVPFTLWSLVWFIGDVLRGITYTPIEYLIRFFCGKAEGGTYYFVLLLCQFYLLSLLLVPLARAKGKLLLIAAALVQLVALSPTYLGLVQTHSTVLAAARLCGSLRLFPMWIFYFSFGIVCGFQIARLKQTLNDCRWRILGVTTLLGVLSLVEPELIFQAFGLDRRFVPYTLSSGLYSLAFVLCFLAFAKVPARIEKALYRLSGKTYPIYLLHWPVMAYVTGAIRRLAPWVLNHGAFLLMPLMLAVGLAIPLLLMAAAAVTPARMAYRYLFG